MSEVVDLEVGRYALRTFRFEGDDFFPILNTPNRGGWTREGTCEAICWGSPPQKHEAPHLGCECGIYGSHSFYDLKRQYMSAHKFVAVIAAEGRTVVGTRGLRTERARVIAYACDMNAYSEPSSSYLNWDTGSPTRASFMRRYGPTPIHVICGEAFADARRWKNLPGMIEHFELAWAAPSAGRHHSESMSKYWTD